MKNSVRLFILFLTAFSIFSCSEEEGGPEKKNNTTIEVTGSINVNGNITAIGILSEGVSPVFDLYSKNFGFQESDNSDDNKLNLTINRFSEEEQELSTGSFPVYSSFTEEESLGTWAARAIWWDENRDETIFEQADNSTLQIDEVSETEVSGSFDITLTSKDGIKEIRFIGDFKVPREPF